MARKTTPDGVRRSKKTASAALAAVPAVSEATNNVVSINLEEEIRRRAYEIYLERGGTAGDQSQDWLVAEREVRSRQMQQRAS